MRKRFILAAVLAAALASGAQADPTERIKIDAGRQFFDANCHRCHSVEADKASYGPLLEGVVGRRAGSFPGYPYSKALQAAGFVWTKGAIRAWIEANDQLVPGTKMRHVGITDPTVQDFIVEYLASLKP
ncbi:c-type cytochrome [Rhodobacter capsulatus]|uniref:Cytochrome c n=1 Tax=Rhodobacter capsulatus TaxID=1061 RepID=A0A0Q0QQ56_RHOCA|nr:c-type cytochrome [Rhodobacter capsulatus]KQB17286.1 cytochrome C [Rhodobacter capsulatus]KQB17687.1 cytochrome C [Rhodobacter capsulatus]PZX27312.1 cytochrome c [Rhodobacter capsulatus]QNR64398.1 c-type cytochrome [Rhodobacter capsulatus]WER07806.1 c-type cytochrome [Rhodobacter capsulatus]